MKILLTGASGFIGKNLSEYFSAQKKYELSAPSHGELDLLDQDAVEDFLRANRFDVIIHTANVNTTRNREHTPYDALDGNLRMFYNLRRCSAYYGKMFYFGSGAEYDRRFYVPFMEESYFGRHIPADPYGFSKYIMSEACTGESNLYDLRLFGVYGKYEEWERRFISNAICRVLKGKEITIGQNVYFDYLYVHDLCRIMEWFVSHEPEHHHYNVCRGEHIDLYSLAVTVREILHADCDIVVAKEGWKPEYSGNNSRLLAELGGYEFYDYRKSIEELCDYYRVNIDSIDAERLI